MGKKNADWVPAADKMAKLLWSKKVLDEDYQSAYNFLSLLWNPARASDAVDRLRDTKLQQRRAIDLLRAANLDPAELHDPSGLKHLRQLAKGQLFSPALCITLDEGLVIADGYHRISIGYHLDPYDLVYLLLV